MVAWQQPSNMKILIDISHPAHVHFYRHIRQGLVDQGAEVLVVAREKDATIELLKAFSIPHLVVGRSGHRSWIGQLSELLQRDAFLIAQCTKFRPDLILTRNPSGAQVARVVRAVGVFDTDDGRSVGVHYRAAAPFANVITAPDCLPEDFGPKGRKYPSYKSLAYLHPDLFTPDPGVRNRIGVGNDPFAVVRLVAHDASHDRNARGLDARSAEGLVELLERSMRVLITAEGATPPSLADRKLVIPAEEMHSVLAEAMIVIGDSQTVISEAAILGTPAVRINSWVGASPHIAEMEQKYGLAFSFGPDELESATKRITELIDRPETNEIWMDRRSRMLDEKVNLAEWYLSLVNELARKVG